MNSNHNYFLYYLYVTCVTCVTYIRIYPNNLCIMLVENDSDIIMISVAEFKDAFKSFNKQDIRSSLLSKKQELHNKYKCFHSKFESQVCNYIEKKHYTAYKSREHHRENYVPKNANRLHIISTNFDDATKRKKSFVSNLNKLSPKNKDSLLLKIKEIISTTIDTESKMELYSTIWDFIKKSYDPSYIEVIKLYDKEITDKRWQSYVVDKEWYPDDYILTNNILSTDDNMYDIYCNYVTWKKQMTNIHKTWCLIHKEDKCLEKFDILLNDLLCIFNDYKDKAKTHKHILDFSLEQMLIILKVHKNKDIIDGLKVLDTTNLESSTKFIILDIVDIN